MAEARRADPSLLSSKSLPTTSIGRLADENLCNENHYVQAENSIHSVHAGMQVSTNCKTALDLEYSIYNWKLNCLAMGRLIVPEAKTTTTATTKLRAMPKLYSNFVFELV